MIGDGGVPPGGPPPVRGPRTRLGMPDRLTRWMIFGVGALAGAAVVTPLLTGPGGFPAYALTLSVLVVYVACLGASEVVRRRGIPPVGLVVREGAGFLVPPHRGFSLLAASYLAWVGWITAFAGDTWREVTGDRFDRVAVIVITVLAGITFAVFLPAPIAALRGRPRLELTPRCGDPLSAGHRLRAMVRAGPGPRPAPAHRRPAGPDRGQAGPGGTARPGALDAGTMIRWPTLNLTYLAVHPWLLADVIRHYADHPERRPAIGTRAEYHRLLATLGVPTGQ